MARAIQTVGELKAHLDRYPDDVPVQLAVQPDYPLAETIGAVVGTPRRCRHAGAATGSGDTAHGVDRCGQPPRLPARQRVQRPRLGSQKLTAMKSPPLFGEVPGAAAHQHEREEVCDERGRAHPRPPSRDRARPPTASTRGALAASDPHTRRWRARLARKLAATLGSTRPTSWSPPTPRRSPGGYPGHLLIVHDTEGRNGAVVWRFVPEVGDDTLHLLLGACRGWAAKYWSRRSPGWPTRPVPTTGRTSTTCGTTSAHMALVCRMYSSATRAMPPTAQPAQAPPPDRKPPLGSSHRRGALFVALGPWPGWSPARPPSTGSSRIVPARFTRPPSVNGTCPSRAGHVAVAAQRAEPPPRADAAPEHEPRDDRARRARFNAGAGVTQRSRAMWAAAGAFFPNARPTANPCYRKGERLFERWRVGSCGRASLRPRHAHHKAAEADRARQRPAPSLGEGAITRGRHPRDRAARLGNRPRPRR